MAGSRQAIKGLKTRREELSGKVQWYNGGDVESASTEVRYYGDLTASKVTIDTGFEGTGSRTSGPCSAVQCGVLGQTLGHLGDGFSFLG